MCIYEMSAFPDIFLRGNKKKKNMSMSPTGPVGRISPTLSAVGDMSATCRRHAQLRIYNGMGFGINVYLRSHVDQDFTFSIVQAHIDNHDYIVNDKIVCYFAFPQIGIAVALRPGDFLIFNPQEHHSISSRCYAQDEVYCISSYLKTAVVGLNDNSNTDV